MIKTGEDRSTSFGFIVADSIQTKKEANSVVGNLNFIRQLVDQRLDIGRENRGGELRLIHTCRESVSGNCYVEIKTFTAIVACKKQSVIRILMKKRLDSSKNRDRNDGMIIGQMIIIAY